MDPQVILEPTNKSHRMLFIILTILLTAGIIGGTVYYVLNKQNKELEKQVEDLRKKAEEKKSEPKISQVPELTKEEDDKVKDLDGTESWKTYVSNDLGVSFKYPDSWGDVKVIKFSESELINQSTRSLLKGDTIDITFTKNSKYLVSSKTPDFSYPAGIFISALEEAENGVSQDLISRFKAEEVNSVSEVGPSVIKFDNFKYNQGTLSFFKGLITSGYGPQKSIKKYYLANIKNNNNYKTLNAINIIKDTPEISIDSATEFTSLYNSTIASYKEGEFEAFIKTIKSN